MPNTSNKIKFGATAIYHTFKPGVSALKFSSAESAIAVDTSYGDRNIIGQEFGLYFEDDIRIGNRIKINAKPHT